MSKTKAMFAAVAMATAAMFPQAASAEDVSHATEALTIVDNEAYFGALFTGNNAGNTFTDRYTFSTSVAATLSTSVSSIARNNSGLNLTGFNLYDASGQLVAGTQLFNGSIGQWDLDVYNIENYSLAAGSYWLEVSGSVVGQGAGHYYAGLALAPVPEPETYAMLLGGLGLLAVAARRRKQDATSA